MRRPTSPSPARACDAARRAALARGGAWALLAAAGALDAAPALAGVELAFDATSLEQALQVIGAQRVASADIVLEVPEVAEDGAHVAVRISSALPDTRAISIVVEHNPNPLVVHFALPAGTEPFVATRVKVAASGRIYALVDAGGTLYSTHRECRVMVGGCG